MSTWLHGQRHAFAEALRVLRDDGFATILAMVVMGIGCAAALAAISFFVALPGLPARLGAAPALAVYLQVDATDADAAAVEKHLRAHAEVGEVRRIDPDAALRDLGGSMGLEGIADTLPRNPLPHTITATLRDPTFEALDRVRAQALALPKVDAAVFDRDAAQRLDARMRLARAVSLAACTALILLVVGASATATLHWLPGRSQAMRLTRILGGTPAQVLAPAVYAAALQALAGSVIGAGLIAVAAWLLVRQAEAAIGVAGWTFAGPKFYLILSMCYVIIGAGLGVALAVRSSRKSAEK